MKAEDLSDDPTEEEIESYLESVGFTCARCGEDSRGEAGIGDKFYCHRDERSCYMATEQEGAPAVLLSALIRARSQSEVRRLDITYWRERAQMLSARTTAVRRLHTPVRLKEHTGTSWHSAPDDHLVCAHCTDPDGGGYDTYPCETLRALDGEG